MSEEVLVNELVKKKCFNYNLWYCPEAPETEVAI